MNAAFLDAAVQLIQVVILLTLIVQNVGISRRLKSIEDKLNK